MYMPYHASFSYFKLKAFKHFSLHFSQCFFMCAFYVVETIEVLILSEAHLDNFNDFQ